MIREVSINTKLKTPIKSSILRVVCKIVYSCFFDDLSKTAQQIVQKYTHSISQDPLNNLDLSKVSEVIDFFHKPLWELPTLEDFDTLLNESEYAAWVIYNRYYLNHYTITVFQLYLK